MPIASGDILQDRYRIVSPLGQGGMGAVYLAEDLRLKGRRCATKEQVPDPTASPQVLTQLRQQFQMEASILAALDHPNLARVSDYFVERGNEYLVMDYVEGEDLETVLQQHQGPLPERTVLLWSNQVLDALHYLHTQQPHPIIHRDIKPANIILTPTGKVKLVDFGLVKLLDTQNPRTAIVMQGMGTPEYTPLEQYANNAGHTDARSDIYALGATLYHLLSGVAPPPASQRVVTHTTPLRQFNPQLSAGTEAAIRQAMELHPTHRFQSAPEMRQALTLPQPQAPTLPFTQQVLSVPPQPTTLLSGLPLWLIGGGIIGLLFVVAVISFGAGGFLSNRSTPPTTTVAIVVAEVTSSATNVSEAVAGTTEAEVIASSTTATPSPRAPTATLLQPSPTTSPTIRPSETATIVAVSAIPILTNTPTPQPFTSTPLPVVPIADTSAPTAIYRGNAQRTGVYVTSPVSEFHGVRWQFKTGESVESSPAVVNGVAYFGSWDGNLYAVDAASGQERWRYETGDWIFYSPVIAGSTLYFGSADGNLYALDLVNGSERWRFETEERIASSPIVFNDTVFFGGANHYLYALNAQTGQEIWSFEAESGIGSSPTIANGILYFGSWDSHLYALDIQTGQEQWHFETEGSIISSPAVADDVVYFGSRDGTFYAVDRYNGRELWHFDTGADIRSSPAVANGMVYFGSQDKHLYALDSHTGNEMWRFPVESWLDSSPSIVADLIYFRSAEGDLYVANRWTGEEQWYFETDGWVVTSPVVVDGVVYFGSSDGYLYAVQ